MSEDDLDLEAEAIARRVLHEPAARRSQLVDVQCRGDAALRRRIEALLKAIDEADGFLEEPALAVGDEAVARSMIGQLIGPYRISSVIAAGGMGTVFRAEQERPRRVVALKLMRPGIMSRAALRRFRHEADILARLDHPHIAKVFTTGTHDAGFGGVPYFAMELVPEAKTIIEFAEARGLSLRARLELFCRCCQAVHHGHQKGVIHRDLKPENILVDGTGRPRVIDFGIALTTDADQAITAGSIGGTEFIGTLLYMSPEQLDSRVHDVDTRSDVYALGVVLFELIASRPPFDPPNTSFIKAVQELRDAVPQRLGAINVKVDRDVETIVHKAMHKDPAQRYESPGALAADIERYLQWQPIVARPPTLGYQLGRFVRRHTWPVVAVTALALLAAGTLLLGVVITYAATLGSARAAEAAARAMAERQLERQRVQAYGGLNNAVLTALREHDVAAAAKTLEEAPADLRGWEWRHLETRMSLSMGALAEAGGCVLDVDLDPRGVLMAEVVKPADGAPAVVRVSSLSEGLRRHGTVELAPSSHAADPMVVAFSGDGKLLAIGGRRGALDIWSLDRPDRPVHRLHRSGDGFHIAALAWRPGAERLLAAGSGEGHIALWRVTEGGAKPVAELLATIREHEWFLSDLALSPDGRWLATCSHDLTARLWSIEAPLDPHPVAVLRGHEGYVVAVAFDPQSRRLATASLDTAIRIWDVHASIAEYEIRGDEATGRCIQTLLGHEKGVRDVQFHPRDGTTLASCSVDATVRLWQVEADRQIWELPERGRARPIPVSRLEATLHGHLGGVGEVQFDPRGRWLLSVPLERGVPRFWAPHGVETVPTLLGHGSSVLAAAFNPNGQFVASASGDLTVRFWSVEHAEGVSTLQGHGSVVTDLAFVPGQPCLATASLDGTVRFWSTADPFEAAPLGGILDHETGVNTLAVSADGARIATGTKGGIVRVWSLGSPAAPNLLSTLAADLDEVLDVAFLDSAGTRVATACADAPASIRVWSVGEGSELCRYVVSGAPTTALAVDLDRRLVASGHADGVLRLWAQEPSGVFVEREELRGHTERINALCFHPHEPRLASGSDDRTVRMWHVETGAELISLRGHDGGVDDVAFDPAGNRLASTSRGHEGGDNSIKLWEAAIEPAARVFRGRRATAARRARDIVIRAFQEDVTTKEVLAAIEVEPDLPPDVRAAALRTARFQGDDPVRLMRESWRVVRGPAASDEYAAALQRAVLAHALLVSPHGQRKAALMRLGWARIRNGQHASAIDDLEAARGLNEPYMAPTIEAGLAIAYHEAGRFEEAACSLLDAEDLVGDHTRYPRPEVAALVEEARAWLRRGSSAP